MRLRGLALRLQPRPGAPGPAPGLSDPARETANPPGRPNANAFGKRAISRVQLARACIPPAPARRTHGAQRTANPRACGPSGIRATLEGGGVEAAFVHANRCLPALHRLLPRMPLIRPSPHACSKWPEDFHSTRRVAREAPHRGRGCRSRPRAVASKRLHGATQQAPPRMTRPCSHGKMQTHA